MIPNYSVGEKKIEAGVELDTKTKTKKNGPHLKSKENVQCINLKKPRDFASPKTRQLLLEMKIFLMMSSYFKTFMETTYIYE